MNILITGAAGFIGSHIADAYIAEGHHVVIVDDLSGGVRENVNSKATFYQLDIRSETLEEVFRKEHIDVVNHLAAQMDVRRSVADPQFDASVNVLGVLNGTGKRTNAWRKENNIFIDRRCNLRRAGLFSSRRRTSAAAIVAVRHHKTHDRKIFIFL